MEIRTIGDGDIARCAEIYNYYIENTTVTFEEAPLSAEEFGSQKEGGFVGWGGA